METEKAEKLPLIPIILLDYANNVIYKDKIRPVNFRFKTRQLCNEWGEVYEKFNWRFWQHLSSVEPQVDISDVMADYEEYIKHDIDILYFAITAEIIDLQADKRDTAVWALIADVLIQAALTLMTHSRSTYQIDLVRRLDKCAIDLCHELVRGYQRDSELILTEVPRIQKSVDALIFRTSDFVNKLKQN